MNSVLSRNAFFVREHVGLFKAASNYDIFDAQSGEPLMECREEKLGFITRLLRFTDYKRMTPFNCMVRDMQGNQVLRVSRGVTIFRSQVKVFNENDEWIGQFRQRIFSIGGRFDVLDTNGQYLCDLRGKWTSWEFYFERDGNELARVTKQWAGLAKEMFTSADNYALLISEAIPPTNPLRQLILAAVLCIDLVLKE